MQRRQKRAKKNFFDANEACQMLGLQLVEIRSEAKLNVIREFAAFDYTWIGLTCPGGENCDTTFSEWVWLSDGSIFDGTGMEIVGSSIVGSGIQHEHCAHWWGGNADVAPQNCYDNSHYGTLCESMDMNSP